MVVHFQQMIKNNNCNQLISFQQELIYFNNKKIKLINLKFQLIDIKIKCKKVINKDWDDFFYIYILKVNYIKHCKINSIKFN